MHDLSDYKAIIRKHERNADELAGAGERVFNTLRAELEATYPGQYVLINVGTQKYVVGKNLTEAHRLYKSTFGNSPGWGVRIAASVFADAG